MIKRKIVYLKNFYISAILFQAAAVETEKLRPADSQFILNIVHQFLVSFFVPEVCKNGIFLYSPTTCIRKGRTVLAVRPFLIRPVHVRL